MACEEIHSRVLFPTESILIFQREEAIFPGIIGTMIIYSPIKKQLFQFVLLFVIQYLRILLARLRKKEDLDQRRGFVQTQRLAA